ncbi:MAG: DMT family transporter [Proteobacteria bacterium]|nr:DMT family transporter [Pseudomonadota bacterium]MBU1612391.1 DMT family transporter [Pseudomonadota bacterium]
MVRGLIYSIISGIAFGFLPIFGKLGYACGMDVTLILQSRFLIAAIILLLWFLVADRGALRARPATLAKAAVLGLVFYPLQSWLFISAVERIPASTPTLILYFYPVSVTLLCALLFGSRITRSTALSLLLVTVGCCLVFYDAFLARLDGTGLLYAVGSLLVFTFYLATVQFLMKNENPLTLTFYVICVAGLVWTVAAGGPGRYLALSGEGLAVALGLGLVTGVIAVAFLYKAIEIIGSPMASIFSTIEPAAAVLAAWLILGEPISGLNVTGMLLIIVGIVWPNLRLLRSGATI